MPIKKPDIFRKIRNRFLNIFIRLYLDKEYSPKEVCAGSKRAISQVSRLISQGKFEELEGMLTGDLISKLSHRFESLTLKERQWIAFDTTDIRKVSLFEVGVIFDGPTNQRFVEITIKLWGVHGGIKPPSARSVAERRMTLTDRMKIGFMCTYRFKKEFSKGVTDDWTITQLNHYGYPNASSEHK